VKAGFRATDALSFEASWIRYGGDSVDPNNPQGGNVAEPGNENVLRDVTSDTVSGTISFAPEGSNLVDLDLTGYRSKTSAFEDVVDSVRAVTREVETTGVTLANRSRFAAPGAGLDVVFTYGGEFYVDEQVGRDNTTADGTRGGVPDAKTSFYGAFAQAEIDVERPLGAPGRLTVIPAVRYDRFENEAPGAPSSDDDAVSPKVGASYRPIPELLVFGNWAKAFRAPSFNEVYADDVHFQIPDLTSFPPRFVTNFFIPNPDLKPETARSWEVGAGVDLADILFRGDRFTIKGSYYRSSVDDLINLEVNIPAGCFGAPFPPCGTGQAFGNFSRNVNVASARIDGVEVETSYDSRFVYVRTNFSGINGRDRDTNDHLGVLSPNRFFVDAGVKAPRVDVRLGARVTVADDFTEVNDATLARDGYATGDVYAVWEPASGPLEGFRLDVGVDNVTDADYAVVAAGVSQPGRNVKVAARWRRGF